MNTNTKPTEKRNDRKTKLINSVLKADDVNEEEFFKLLKKQKKNKLEDDEEVIIHKYMIKDYFCVNIVDFDFLSKFVNKETILYNFMCYLDDNNIGHRFKYKTRLDKKQLLKISLIRDVIKLLGFKSFNKGAISQHGFQENIIGVINNSKLFKNVDTFHKLFKVPIDKISELVDLKNNIEDNTKYFIKTFINLMQSTFKKYGLFIKRSRINSKRNKKNEENSDEEDIPKNNKINTFLLTTHNDVHEFVALKHAKNNNITFDAKLPKTQTWSYLNKVKKIVKPFEYNDEVDEDMSTENDERYDEIVRRKQEMIDNRINVKREDESAEDRSTEDDEKHFKKLELKKLGKI